MTHSVDDIRADIAFMKDVVEGGAKPSLRAGVILLAAGLFWAGACFAGYAMAIGALPGGRIYGPYFPLIAMAVFVGLLFVIGAVTPPTAKTPANRAIGTVWNAVGWGIGALVAAAFCAQRVLHNGYVFALLPSIVLVLYGAAWMVGYAVTRRAFQLWLGIGCYISASALGYLVASPTLALAMGVAVLVFAGAPGAYLIAQARR